MTTVYKAYIPCKAEDEHLVLETGALDGVPHVRYNSDTIFIEPMDKQRGIRYMMDLLNAPIEDVVVFGDGTTMCLCFYLNGLQLRWAMLVRF